MLKIGEKIKIKLNNEKFTVELIEALEIISPDSGFFKVKFENGTIDTLAIYK